jgi:hypothetical protein
MFNLKNQLENHLLVNDIPFDDNDHYFQLHFEDLVDEDALEFATQHLQGDNNIQNYNNNNNNNNDGIIRFPSRFNISQPTSCLYWKLSFIHLIVINEIGKEEKLKRIIQHLM